jgi:4-amino-4-deoxy-L-arabinose transferase-like glycosyltransferase
LGHAAWDWAIALGLFVLAAALRVWGVHWSLPYVIHPDEHTIVNAGVHMVKTGDLNPHFFHYPALQMYIQAAVYKLNLMWGVWRGYYTGPESLPDRNFIFALAPGLYVWGRTVTALIGAVTVAGLYGAGRAMMGRGAGLVAALLLLTSPMHVEHSHYLVAEVTMTAFVPAILWASWRLVVRPGVRMALLAGLLVGLCAAAKYNGIFTAIVPATAWALVWFSTRRRTQQAAYQYPRSGRAVAGFGSAQWLLVGVCMALMAVVGFVATNPYVVLDWPGWSRGVTSLVVDVRGPVSSPTDVPSSISMLVGSLLDSDEFITLAGLAGALALAYAAMRRGTQHAERGYSAQLAWLLLLFPPVYTLLMSPYRSLYGRYMIIVLPFLALLAGYGASRLAGWLSARLPTWANIPAVFHNQAVLACIIGLLLAAEPGRQMINFDRYMAAPDNRNLAFEWLMSELRKGHRAAVELQPWQVCAPPPWKCPAPDVYAPLQQLTDRPPQWYADRGYDYVMLLGREYAVLEHPEVSGPRPPDKLAPYLDLPLVKYWPGDDEGGKGPPVLVFRTAHNGPSLKNVLRSGARFGDVAELWGYAMAPLSSKDERYDPADGPVPTREGYVPGGAVGLNLYWRALKDGSMFQPQSHNWTVAVHLVNDRGDIVSQVDVVPLSNGRMRPVHEWYESEFLAGSYNLALPPELPPGTYTIRLALYDQTNGASLPVTTSGLDGSMHNPSGAFVELGRIVVTPRP